MAEKIPVNITKAREFGIKFGYVRDKNFDRDMEQLRMGMEVEQEHTETLSDLGVETGSEQYWDAVALIAIDHLSEFVDYYTRLKKMEAEKEDDRGDYSDADDQLEQFAVEVKEDVDDDWTVSDITDSLETAKEWVSEMQGVNAVRIMREIYVKTSEEDIEVISREEVKEKEDAREEISEGISEFPHRIDRGHYEIIVDEMPMADADDMKYVFMIKNKLHNSTEVYTDEVEFDDIQMIVDEIVSGESGEDESKGLNNQVSIGIESKAVEKRGGNI